MRGTAPRCTCCDDGAVSVDVKSSLNDDSYCEVVEVSVSSEHTTPSSASSSIKRFCVGIVNNGDRSSSEGNTMPPRCICKVNTQLEDISLFLTAECVVRIRRRRVITENHHPSDLILLFCRSKSPHPPPTPLRCSVLLVPFIHRITRMPTLSLMPTSAPGYNHAAHISPPPMPVTVRRPRHRRDRCR